MRSPKTTWIFLALVFLLPLMVYLLTSWYENNYEELPVYNITSGTKENLLKQLPSYNFVNQNGKKLTGKDWDNKILVVDFFFTHCPVICPKMTKSLKHIEENFKDDSAIQLASFSVDPVRDSSAQLKKYSALFGLNTRRWNLITGSKKDIYKLARNGFALVATDGDGGPDDFIHSDKIVLVDARKNIRGYYDGTNSAEIDKLITDIKKLENEN
jgi:protein SCO1/2